MAITEPERLSLEKLRGLASAAPPCISIVLLEREARDARIAFKDALAQVRAKLAASASKHDIASLLDPLEPCKGPSIPPGLKCRATGLLTAISSNHMFASYFGPWKTPNVRPVSVLHDELVATQT